MASARAVASRRGLEISQSRVGWKPATGMPSGKNRKTAATNVGGIFFPQSKSLGIDRSTYSPSLQRKIVYAGTAHGSFEQGKQSLQELAGVKVLAKQVERLTRHIGSERVAERQAAVVAFQELPLTDKHQTPAEVASPEVAVVMVDGGRLQILERGAASVAAADDEEPVALSAREAATAGRKFAEGWPVYVRWIEWLWQGQVEQIIAELAQRQAELGTPEPADGETSPRRLVAEALTYLQTTKTRCVTTTIAVRDYRLQAVTWSR